MKYFFTTLFFLLSLAASAHAAVDAQVRDAGFVPSNIWYSEDPFFAGDSIRIYTVIFNGSLYDLTGSVEFLDNGVLVGKTGFTVARGGHVRDVSVPWKVTEGKHVITARTVDVATVKDGKKLAVVLENVETGKSERLVDLDTDGDNVGNTEDTDDDNDGVPDIEEVRKGTDPLNKDTDGDGILDKEEIELAEKNKNGTTTPTAPKGSIAGTLQTVEGAIPAPVKEGAALGANIVEQFRAGEGYQFRLAKEEKAREIEAIKLREAASATSTASQSVQGATDRMLNIAEKPFAYVLFAIFAVLQYVFEWQIAFYGIILYFVYRLIKWMVRRSRDR